MTRAQYDPQSAMRASLARYFEINGFGADGGYQDAWVEFKLGPIPFPFPNTQARVRALRYHDLHHILTDYDTDTVSEFEISAWELGAGCRGFAVAWQINLMGLVAGLCVAPRRMWRAFVRGRRSRSLYGLPYEALLDASVAATRGRLTVPDHGQSRGGLGDALWLGLAAVAGLSLGAIFLPITLALLPLGLAATVWQRRRRAAAAAQRPASAGAMPPSAPPA